MYEKVDEKCLPPIREALLILGGKWSFLVLAQLYISPLRFNQLRRKLEDISTKALTDTLRHLEHNEIVNRQVFPTVPVTVEYSLSEKGLEFQSVLVEMYNWGTKWGKTGALKGVNLQENPITTASTLAMHANG